MPFSSPLYFDSTLHVLGDMGIATPEELAYLDQPLTTIIDKVAARKASPLLDFFLKNRPNVTPLYHKSYLGQSGSDVCLHKNSSCFYPPSVYEKNPCRIFVRLPQSCTLSRPGDDIYEDSGEYSFIMTFHGRFGSSKTLSNTPNETPVTTPMGKWYLSPPSNSNVFITPGDTQSADVLRELSSPNKYMAPLAAFGKIYIHPRHDFAPFDTLTHVERSQVPLTSAHDTIGTCHVVDAIIFAKKRKARGNPYPSLHVLRVKDNIATYCYAYTLGDDTTAANKGGANEN